jgi:ABC-type polysaccharide/polyol phosphate transport system ATPase subunit
MGAPAIEIENVSKAYRIYPSPRHQLQEMMTLGSRTYHHAFWALRDVSLRVEKGTTLGLVGNNGSGKSTLLHIVAGVTSATTGRVAVEGRLASLLELGAGFNPDFSGRENVELFGVVSGLTQAEARARVPRIADFAGIGDFINRAVRTYSSGMFVRLAFSAAIHVDPDVLLVDEALAVGDVIFQHQCVNRIRELQAAGTTIMFVSHDLAMIRSICNEAILLHEGRIEAQDDAATIANLYHAKTSATVAPKPMPRAARTGSHVATGVPFQPDPGFEARTRLFRHGTGAARIRQIELLDVLGLPISTVDFNQPVVLRVHVEYYEDAPFSILGFGFRDKGGTDVVGTNTHEEQAELPPRKAGETLVVDFKQRLPIAHGTYSVSSALAYDREKPEYFDWVDNALVVTVHPPESGKAIHGKVWLPVEITVYTQ